MGHEGGCEEECCLGFFVSTERLGIVPRSAQISVWVRRGMSGADQASR